MLCGTAILKAERSNFKAKTRYLPAGLHVSMYTALNTPTIASPAQSGHHKPEAIHDSYA